MDFKKITLVTLVSAVMFSSAYANQQKEEEEDSVTEWGPWAIPVATAAGPEATINALIFAGAAGSEYVFIDPDFAGPDSDTPVDVASGCLPGAPCGYASYHPVALHYGYGEESQEAGARILRPRMSMSSLTPVSAGFSMQELTIDGGEGRGYGRGALQYLVTPGGDSDQYIDILSLPLQQGPFGGFVEYDRDNRRLDGLVDTSFWCLGNCRGYRPPNMRLDHGNLGGLSGENLSHGFWISSANNLDEGYIQSYLGSFVYGTTSTLDDLSSLKNELGSLDNFAQFNNQIVATYIGHTALGAGVNLNINFTDNTWGGSFNNGYDTRVTAYSSANGTSVTGHVGFDINGGTIDGVNLVAGSSALSAKDGSVNGSVTASFFGPNASEIGGVADIEKTKSNTSPANIQQPSPSYENAAHVTTFSTHLVKTPNPKRK
ncbi:transferrin-binding protein-like solute binding protein [Neptuniibacter sp. UBA6509]|uniref:transferrin-binding protein-like solute binding protein n=1 Tax=Neptuniibacter sp. UBA6509 TaxID=1946976 RepID=UPI000C5D1964|nr:transferrin-binding protein-like solute binding protein [Neptuniibacter sp. UBA6509]MAY42126.1 hypothetical protein [Oceanospirillaceae bacterium]|tara:strand:+ start:19908 stop:21200 length:1293 start_codon:yes stop_codon:yes gene_type:complete